jgi:hypothetical protein
MADISSLLFIEISRCTVPIEFIIVVKAVKVKALARCYTTKVDRLDSGLFHTTVAFHAIDNGS